MFNERSNIRYSTHGKARIEGVLTGEALLNDLSYNGCCLEFVGTVDVDDTKVYKIEISPEPDSGIEPFTVSAEPRWLRPAPYSCAIGFSFNSAPKGKHVQHYMEFLAALLKPDKPGAGPTP
jgi:hypothetical protein